MIITKSGSSGWRVGGGARYATPGATGGGTGASVVQDSATQPTAHTTQPRQCAGLCTIFCHSMVLNEIFALKQMNRTNYYSSTASVSNNPGGRPELLVQ